MSRRDQVVVLLKAHEDELRGRGVQGLFLFGSVGRGEERAGSDVDLFFDHRPGLGLEVVAIQERVREIVPGKVDVTTRKESASAPARAHPGLSGQSLLMRQSDPRPWLHDILEAIVSVRAAVDDMSLEAYVASWTTRRAAERAIEIISEASRHLPEALRAAEPHLPWIIGIGNVLRHAYHRVNDEVIHVIVTRQRGPLEAAVRRLLDRLEAGHFD
jgi:uncharacterized protein with HEPN domain/predicted nucleotidyltransferase